MGRKPVYTFAKWRVKDGQLAAVSGLLAELMVKSTAEEGSLLERNRVVPYPRAYGIAVEKFMLLSSSRRKSELSSSSESVSVESRVGEHGYRSFTKLSYRQFAPHQRSSRSHQLAFQIHGGKLFRYEKTPVCRKTTNVGASHGRHAKRNG